MRPAVYSLTGTGSTGGDDLTGLDGHTLKQRVTVRDDPAPTAHRAGRVTDAVPLRRDALRSAETA